MIRKKAKFIWKFKKNFINLRCNDGKEFQSRCFQLVASERYFRAELSVDMDAGVRRRRYSNETARRTAFFIFPKTLKQNETEAFYSPGNRDSEAMVQHPGGHEEQAHAPDPPRNQAAPQGGRPLPDLLRRVRAAGTEPDRRLDRHPGRSPGEVRLLPQHAARARLRTGRGPWDSGAHLLQERKRQPPRLPQDQFRPSAGLLCEERGRHELDDRDRRRPVGRRARLCREGLRHRIRRLPGQDQL